MEKQAAAGETLLKWIGGIVTLGGLMWTVTSFMYTNRLQVDTRQFEARRPFLERQLELYTEATKSAGILASSADEKALGTAREQFWELYFGRLAMIETGGVDAPRGGVEAAMKHFGDALNGEASKVTLQNLSLDLAHACRDSLAKSWDVSDWKAPRYSKLDDSIK